jgi:hypothetical protein
MQLRVIQRLARHLMRRRLLHMMPVLALTAVLALAVVSPVAADGLRIGIDITPPPPPRIVLTAPPQLVVVPGSPVFHAPGVSINFFAYGGRYYSFHEGAWFAATAYGGPWTTISVGRVPQPVLAVPVAYYKIPPGHAKKMHPEGRAAGRSGCPPGLAKQGRC